MNTLGQLLVLISLLWVCIACSHAAVVSLSWEVSTGWVNPDGVWRTAYVFKDLETGVTHFPGPTVHAHQGDTLVVNVVNALSTESLSLHWHGLLQRSSPWMDGTPYITQYPIGPGETFSYVMPLGDQHGTFWYHSHSGTQYADGMYGMVVVHKLHDTVNAAYNVTGEAELLLSEWYHRPASVIDSELKGDVWKSSTFFPDYESGLINGKFKFNCTQAQQRPPSWTTDNPVLVGCQEGAYSTVPVDAGHSLRLRILNAASGFTLRFSIDNHQLIVVAVDGIEVEPVTVQEINVYVAQRYDVILQTTASNPNQNYWIRARTFPLSVDPDDVGEIKAILAYEGDATPTTSRWMEPIALTNNSDLRLATPDTPPQPTMNFNISLQCNKSEWTCYANDIAFQSPRVPALVNACQGNDPSQGNPRSHKLEVPYGAVVDLIVNNLGDQTHPIHLHGHHFYVLGEGSPSAGVYQNHSRLNLEDPVMRDTVQLEQHSWVVIRFVADNPGTWVFHCHIEWHLEAGMLLFIEEAADRIPDPPATFPGARGMTCTQSEVDSASFPTSVMGAMLAEVF